MPTGSVRAQNAGDITPTDAVSDASLAAHPTDDEILQRVRSQPGYHPVSPAPDPETRADMFLVAWQEFTKSPTVRVIVSLDIPEYQRLRDLSIGTKQPQFAAQADERLASAIRDGVDAEVAKLPHGTCNIIAKFKSVPGGVLEVDAEALQILESQPSVKSVMVDRPMKPLLDGSVPAVRAPSIWAQGFEASDWYVAVLDTGILATHQAFAGKDIVQACFSGSGECPNGASQDTSSPDAARHFESPYLDDHGTHVAGIATCNGQDDGVARSANLIAIQIFRRVDGEQNCGSGVSHCALVFLGDMLRGLDHVYSLRNTYTIASVNMSFGMYVQQSVCENPGIYDDTILNLRAVDIVTVAAAGNGASCSQIVFPACMNSVVSVGATDNGVTETSFSDYDAGVLDVYAPGLDVYAPLGTGNGAYGNKSGTSMAAPHVAGGVALMRDVLPQATADELVTALTTTGLTVSGRCVSTPTEKRIALDSAVGYFLDSGRTWVRIGATGVKDGRWAHPYSTIAEGVANCPPGERVVIRAVSDPTPITINQPAILDAWDGTVTLGQ